MRHSILFLALTLLATQALATTKFCGNLGTVRAGYDGDDFISSIVLYDKNILDDPATAYNDKYLNIRNDDNSVTDGYETVALLKRLFQKETQENLVDYAYETQKLRGLDFQVCLYGYTISTRNNGGRVEARANNAVTLKASIGSKPLYDGSIEDALTYLRSKERKASLENNILQLQDQVLDLEKTLKTVPLKVSDQL